jgi:hypothetical protein
VDLFHTYNFFWYLVDMVDFADTCYELRNFVSHFARTHDGGPPGPPGPPGPLSCDARKKSKARNLGRFTALPKKIPTADPCVEVPGRGIGYFRPEAPPRKISHSLLELRPGHLPQHFPRRAVSSPATLESQLSPCRLGACLLALCPVRGHIWDSCTEKGLKNHDKSASDAGSASRRYWDSWRSPEPAAPQT